MKKTNPLLNSISKFSVIAKKVFFFLPFFESWWFRVSIFCLLFLFPSFSPAREAQITILFTNDHHGQVDPVRESDSSKPVGGVTRRMALIEKIRKEVGEQNVILVDGGGLFTGTALSGLTNGEVDCAAYQLMRYDAIVMGVHDFDYGKKYFLETRKKYKTPWISANVVSAGQPFMRPYVLKYAGIRVGMIGFSNPDTPKLTHRDNVRGLAFNPPGQTAKGLHSIFKKDADIFVVLSHLGVEADKKFAKDNPFIHVVIGGFSETVLKDPIVNLGKDGNLVGPIIGQAGSNGLYLGRLDLSVEGHRDPKTKNASYSITDYHYKLIPITADLPEDPQMTALLEKFKGQLKEKPLGETLATISGDFTLATQGDSLIGMTATDAMRKAAQTEIALLNNDSFKSDFKSGDLTRDIFYQIYPADDEVVALDLPGSYLRKMIEASAVKKGQGGFLQVSGLKIEKTGEGLNITVGNEPLSEKRKYLVAVSDFLAGGGDGYELLLRVKSRRKTQLMVRELLERALKDKQKISPADFEKRWNIP